MNITQDISKIRKARKVGLSKRAIMALEHAHAWATAHKRFDGRLFPAWDKDGNPIYPSIQKPLKRAATAVLGTDRGSFHTSCFRPARITFWVKEGKPVNVVANMVGHSVQMTMTIYQKVADQTLMEFHSGSNLLGQVKAG